MSKPPKEAVLLVPALLSLPDPATVALRHKRVTELRALIGHLSPERDWVSLSRKHHKALMFLWGAWLGFVEELHALGALPRRGGNAGRGFAAPTFTPLLHAVLHQPPPTADVSLDCPFRKPTLASVLECMDTIGVRPTPFQFQLVLEHVPLSELMVRTEKAGWFPPTDRALNGLSGSLAGLLLPAHEPASLDSLSITGLPAQVPGRRHHARQVRLLTLTAASRILDEIELASRRGIISPAQWDAALADNYITWDTMLAPYLRRAAAASEGGQGVLPDRTQLIVLWLMLRDVLARGPRSGSLRADKGVLLGPSQFDLGNPLDLLRLALGVRSPKEASASTRAPGDADRVLSCVVRAAHGAAQRRAFQPILKMTALLAGQPNPDARSPADGGAPTFAPPPLNVRIASFLLGACRAPEDLARLLPYLDLLPVAPGKSSEVSAVVRARITALAASARKTHPTLRAQVHALLVKWEQTAPTPAPGSE